MESMGSRSATELLLLPVQLHGIRLGRPVDLLLDLAEWRGVGFVVVRGGGSPRLLAFPPAGLRGGAAGAASARPVLGGVGRLRRRSRSFGARRGARPPSRR